MKTAILFTANDAQLAPAHHMVTTLRDSARGRYDGDIWVLSTHLGQQAQSYLKNRGIRYFVSEMEWADQRMNWQALFPELSPGDARKAFHAYRNKRMSKLIFSEWMTKHGQNYDAVAISDNDLYYQDDIRGLFELAANECVNYALEDDPIVPGSGIWKKDYRYRQLTGNWDHDGGPHEINIGFVIARPDVLDDLFKEIRERFVVLPPALIREYNWHDQDLARVVRAQAPERFALFPENTILHLCGGGMDIVEQTRPGMFINRVTGQMPRIVHFGGGTWKNFRAIAPSYRVDSQDIFDDINQRVPTRLKGAISTVDFNIETGVLHVKGWSVSQARTMEVVLATRQLGMIGVARLVNRPDVEKSYPGSAEYTSGWEFSRRLTGMRDGDVLVATLVSDGSVCHLEKQIERS